MVKDLQFSDPCVLLFIESKKQKSNINDIDEVEHQAYTACAAYLVAYKLPSVKAMTTVGTKARMWECRRGDDYLNPLFGEASLSDVSQYIEAHSSEAGTLRKHLDACKPAESTAISVLGTQTFVPSTKQPGGPSGSSSKPPLPTQVQVESYVTDQGLCYKWTVDGVADRSFAKDWISVTGVKGNPGLLHKGKNLVSALPKKK